MLHYPLHTSPTVRLSSKLTLLTQLIVDGLGCSSLPVIGHTTSLHSGAIPVNHVVRFMSMDYDAVLRVSTLDRLLVCVCTCVCVCVCVQECVYMWGGEGVCKLFISDTTLFVCEDLHY